MVSMLYLGHLLVLSTNEVCDDDDDEAKQWTGASSAKGGGRFSRGACQ